MPDLSVLIPARNEMFLKRTIEDVLAHAKADTEVIAVLDGALADPAVPMHPKVTLVYHPESVGQRAATNEAARLSEARYVMKLDAHSSMAPGFDVALIKAAAELGEDVTQIPAQRNLHAFDWVCDGCKERRYQGPTPQTCKCGSTAFHREMVWQPRRGVCTTTWRFDRDLHFQYFGEFKHRPAARGTDFPETMSCLGACFFMSRARYWELGGLDEAHGSWGQMGTEVGCKSWLSGGRMVTNLRTWFAHMFRTQGGDFTFPYPMEGSAQDKAREYSRKLWLNDAWPKQVRSLSWLVDHFRPVPGWEARQPAAPTGPAPSATGPTKGIVYYSDCRGDEAILGAAIRQLKRATNGHHTVAVTLAPLKAHFDRNIVMSAERGYLTMFRQILAGLEASTADIVFFCEHDVLYHPSHFEFTPPRSDRYYYNRNVWKVDAATGRALHYDCDQTSGLVAYRALLLEHYRKRVELVEREGYRHSMGFEPGTHATPRGVDDYGAEWWMSPMPNVDIRHGFNLTRSRWSQDQFRNKKYCQGWTEADEVPGWGSTKGRFAEFLREAGRE